MARKDTGRGLTDRKICLAVTIGIVFGLILALLRLNDKGSGPQLTSPDIDSTTRIQDAATGARDPAKLEQEYKKVLGLLKEALKQRDNVNDKLDMAIAEKEEALRKLRVGGLEGSSIPKGGPYGTVKSIRTNPTIAPDRSVNPALADILESIAPSKEVVVAISNNYIRDMLRTWFEGLKRVGVKNYIVVALDDAVVEFCRENDVPVYRKDASISEVQKDTGDNHAISGSKFHLLRDFLSLGYSVLLSDVDIVYLRNPFNHLHRDCDVESMTDGFDNATAYGYDDVTDDPAMGWARYAHTMRVFVFNSGLFYIRPTVPSLELLDRVTARLAKEKAWDQAVFNEELFYPSHPGYVGLHASTRVMDYYLFMNSKVLFREVRKDPGRFGNHVPVTIHVNYHPEKHPRMLSIVDYYVHGKKNALDDWPDGSRS